MKEMRYCSMHFAHFFVDYRMRQGSSFILDQLGVHNINREMICASRAGNTAFREILCISSCIPFPLGYVVIKY